MEDSKVAWEERRSLEGTGRRNPEGPELDAFSSREEAPRALILTDSPGERHTRNPLASSPPNV